MTFNLLSVILEATNDFEQLNKRVGQNQERDFKKDELYEQVLIEREVADDDLRFEVNRNLFEENLREISFSKVK